MIWAVWRIQRVSLSVCLCCDGKCLIQLCCVEHMHVCGYTHVRWLFRLTPGGPAAMATGVHKMLPS